MILSYFKHHAWKWNLFEEHAWYLEMIQIVDWTLNLFGIYCLHMQCYSYSLYFCWWFHTFWRQPCKWSCIEHCWWRGLSCLQNSSWWWKRWKETKWSSSVCSLWSVWHYDKLSNCCFLLLLAIYPLFVQGALPLWRSLSNDWIGFHMLKGHHLLNLSKVGHLNRSVVASCSSQHVARL